ncbi:MAG TPA: hypothetical protein PK152_04605 [Anaerolineales bacterium]|nr:hypothetical protein [Anaerolineales bacterium]
MYLLTFVLHNPDLLEEVLEAWEKVGVKGVTILPGTGLGRMSQSRFMRDDLPLMPSLEDFYEEHPQMMSRTMFTALKDDSLIDRILEVTQSLVGDLSQPETGILFVTPIVRAHGLEKGKKK